MIREQCSHWRSRGKGKKKKLFPSTRISDTDPTHLKCNFCGASFPIRSVDMEKLTKTYNDFLEQLNQLQFFAVHLTQDIGSDKELFSSLKKLLPEYLSVQNAIIPIIMKIDQKNAQYGASRSIASEHFEESLPEEGDTNHVIAKYITKLSTENRALVKNELEEVAKTISGNQSKETLFQKTINDYEEKELVVADFVHHTDSKELFVIRDIDTSDILYEGRQEYLAWTAEGEAHPVCSRVVTWFEAVNGKIYLDTKIK